MRLDKPHQRIEFVRLRRIPVCRHVIHVPAVGQRVRALQHRKILLRHAVLAGEILGIQPVAGIEQPPEFAVDKGHHGGIRHIVRLKETVDALYVGITDMRARDGASGVVAAAVAQQDVTVPCYAFPVRRAVGILSEQVIIQRVQILSHAVTAQRVGLEENAEGFLPHSQRAAPVHGYLRPSRKY